MKFEKHQIIGATFVIINAKVNTSDSHKSIKESNNWNQVLKINEIVRSFSKNIYQLWTKAAF